MKLFSSLFSKKKSSKKTKDNDDIPKVVTTTKADDATVASGESSTTSRKNKHKSSSKTSTSSPPSPDFVAIAEEWMAAMNAPPHKDTSAEDYEKLYTSYYESNDTPIILEDGEEYKPQPCARILHTTFQSFPDFKFHYEDVVVSPSDPNTVTVRSIVVSGTHSGKPYTILPGVLPELPTSGKHCVNDEQEFILTFSPEGKIAKCVVIALGSCTGFAGIYTRAGGDLSPLGL